MRMIEARRAKSNRSRSGRHRGKGERGCRRGVCSAAWRGIGRTLGEDPLVCHVLWRAVVVLRAGICRVCWVMASSRGLLFLPFPFNL